MKKALITLIATLLLVTACSEPPILKVVLLDSEFNEMSMLASQEELSQFSKIWFAKQEVKGDVSPSWNYWLDISPSARWRYSDKGYAQFETNGASPIYKINEAEKFSSLLKVPD